MKLSVLAISGLLPLLSGCVQWPDEGQGGMAHEDTPWDSYLMSQAFLAEHQALRQRVAESQQQIELLRLRGAIACLPERHYQASMLLDQVRGELAEGLYADANERLLLLEEQLYRLGVRLNHLIQHQACGAVKYWSVAQQAQPSQPQADTSPSPLLLEGLLESEQFATDKAELLPEFQHRLMRLAKALADQPQLQLTIMGHTDSRGSDAYNLSLAQSRAVAVKTALIAFGASPEQLIVSSLGEAMPIGDNASATGQLANRRVSFKVVAIDAGSETTAAATQLPQPSREDTQMFLPALPLKQWPNELRR